MLRLGLPRTSLKVVRKQPASIVLNRCQTSADPSQGAPTGARATQNDTPATQNETEVLQVLHLPRKMRLRCSKCCACHAKAARVHSGAPPGRSAKVRRQLSTMDAGGVCVARPALEPRQSHFAWQAQHSDHLIVILRGRCSTRRMSREVRRSPATIEYYGRRLLLRGECNTWRTSVSFCVAGAALGTPQSHFAWQGAEIGASQGHFALQVQQLVRGSPATEWVLHLPRKMKLRCSQCCTCHAK